MVYAIVEKGKVINIAESDIGLGNNWILVTPNTSVSIGDMYTEGKFYSPDGELKLSPELQLVYDNLRAENQELREENNMLVECVLELSSIVYA